MHQGLFFSCQGPEAGQTNTQNNQRSASACRHIVSLSLLRSQFTRSGAISSPQAKVARMGKLCLRKMASPVWRNDSADGSTRLSSVFSAHQAAHTRFSSPCSSPLCLLTAGAQGKWQQTKSSVLALQRMLAYLDVYSCWTEPVVLFTARCYVDTFPSSGGLGWGALQV